ncbi:hypothetical protein QFW77_10560 [Luteimonas sp. RD2P54]|uniref:Uncharacterized protein n=1 Tax=Luteimonas endophytica TaxID=3042023 RepID=A0ABT6J9C4_9GAMM|nr:DUF6587 family protein [Luteimonas endophytica]MDH5823427.1 hypothetical protein [Luteimonas endophytica]
MDASTALQYAVVGLAVAISAWVVLAKQAPGTARRLRTAAALALLRRSGAPWSRALGRRIAPAAGRAGDACGGCDGCGPGDATR